MLKLWGFNTGTIFRLKYPLEEGLKNYAALGCNAVELCYVAPELLTSYPIEKIKTDWLKPFSWVSFHAPVFDNSTYNDHPKALEILDAIDRLYKRIHFNLAVFHPTSFSDFSVLDKYNFPLGFENMDNRKKDFKIPGEFVQLFDGHPSWKMILDLNHCFTNDKFLNLARDFYKSFNNSIAEIHLSGYVNLHEPLYQNNQRDILNAVPDLELPVILESACNSFEEAGREVKFIKDNFN